MKQRELTWEQALYLLAIGLGLAVRLHGLGAAPLGDAEAGLALRAWALAQGKAVSIGPQPGYVLPTAGLFFLGGAHDALARLWPALVGALLPALVWFWRDRLGRPAALWLAFGLALDPGLVTVSRLADGTMPALFFTLAALTAIRYRQAALIGALALLAAWSSPSAWLGLLALILTAGVLRLLGEPLAVPRLDARRLALGALVVALSLMTGFLRVPSGLSGAGEALLGFLHGWRPPAQVPLAWMFGALLDEALPLVFALVGALLCWRQERAARYAALWLGLAVLTVLAYPAARTADLVWPVVPLWMLAAWGLSRLPWSLSARWVSLGEAALAFTLLTFAWLDLAALTLVAAGTEYWLRLGVLAAALLLLAVVTVLVGAGWSWPEAQQGLALALTLFLGLLSLRGTLRDVPSLWRPAPEAGQVRLLRDTLGDLGEWHTGRRDALPLQVQEPVSPAVHWALRDLPWQPVVGFGPAAMPKAVLRPADLGDLSLPAAYRGQSFSVSVRPVWDGQGITLLRWFTRRQVPQTSEQVVLWARGDLFPGGSLAAKDTSSAAPAAPHDIPER